MNTPARDHFVADFERVFPALPGADLPWLVRARSAAMARFADSGLPDAHDEEWKYTRVAAIENNDFVAASRSDDDEIVRSLVDQMALAGGNGPADGSLADGHLLVFIDGRHSPLLSRPGQLPTGARLSPIGEALAATPEALEPYFAEAFAPTAFAALNTAFMADGASLHLARGTVVEQPIHLLFIATQHGAAISPHNLIVAEDGAQATIVEHYVGADGAVYLSNALTRIFAAADARIEHYKLQQEGSQAFHIAGIHAEQAQGSSLLSHSVSFGARLARNDISTTFAGPRCAATMDGLYIVGGQQHVDNHTRVDHSQPHGTSSELYRGILDGRSRAVFNGKVIVHPGAQKTSARQANHNLLLSSDAEIDSKPQLEIYADDVQCTHAATVGQLDDNQLFYLRARGIDAAMARSLLVQAFAHDVIERIRVAALRTRIEQILFSRLPQGERIRQLT